MNLIKIFILVVTIVSASGLFAKQGGDDAGNGGFAYKQSIKVLQMASQSLEEKIRASTLSDLVSNPERRLILEDTLRYENIEQLPKKKVYRGGKLLAMNYVKQPPKVIVLKPYFEAFMGTTDENLQSASLEVQKRLLHEASHIWGYREEDSEKFSIAFLKNAAHEDTRDVDIEINPEYCSCLNGKADSSNSCNNFCESKPHTDQPILYVNTLFSSINPKLKSLYDWCTTQLASDYSTPLCMLQADQDEESLQIPVMIKPGSNAFSANVQNLNFNKYWKMKLVVTRVSSNASTEEFDFKRIKRVDTTLPPSNPIATSLVNQYSCLQYGGYVNASGTVVRTTFARQFFYFLDGETPAPIPSTSSEPLIVCHDEQRFPGADSALYERLELISAFSVWDKSDEKFLANPNNGRKVIDEIISERLLREYGIAVTGLSLFKMLYSFDRPSSGTPKPLGYVLTTFLDRSSGKSFCPKASDYGSAIPLFNILSDYIGETEGLYFAEKESETIMDGNNPVNVSANMFIKEGQLVRYGFYMNNGLKVLATQDTIQTKTIHYYWPISNTVDPLTQAGRKLFTVKNVNDNGSDKRLGCVPN